MKYDVVIIGGGLGGLSAGAFLAKKGKNVLLLEQHFMVGGAATVFSRKNINIEVGLHEMDYGEWGYDIKRYLLEYLQIEKKIELISLPEAWNVSGSNISYTVPEGIENAQNYLISQFPHEEKGIKKYFKMLKKTAYTMGKLPYDMTFLEFMIYPFVKLPLLLKIYFNQKSTAEVMDGLFKDDKLKKLLNANLLYYHDNPYEFSWYYHALAQYNYYNGAKYIKGGSASLSNALAEIITENGGTVEVMCNVEKVNVEQGKVKSVTYKNKRSKEVITVDTEYVIANCAPAVLYNELVDKEYIDKSLEGFKESSSLYTVYIIFKENIQNIYKDSAYSTFITDNDYDKSFSEMKSGYKHIPIEDREFVLVNYGAIDSGLNTVEGDKRAVGVFCGASYLDEWENLSKEEYKAKKDSLAEALFKRAEKYFPNLKDYVEYYEVSTPKTIKKFMKTPSGTAYGYANNSYLKKGRVPRFSRTIKNLLFAGAYSFPGGGFTGALISGYMAGLNLLSPQWPYIFRRVLFITAFAAAVISSPKWFSALIGFF